ncbi:hypothetical protein J437_LFUL004341 [Ladona fulva]|uniref:PiggyBac transposable element-derived protein domain-containing protein n=1 Tax=Ladona fulva TaxID=123851 RepID=A0A8K0NZV2_LADFU|nr:hypothetical protein J437_LFUL004341 [Ladona fulva]
MSTAMMVNWQMETVRRTSKFFTWLSYKIVSEDIDKILEKLEDGDYNEDSDDTYVNSDMSLGDSENSSEVDDEEIPSVLLLDTSTWSSQETECNKFEFQGGSGIKLQLKDKNDILEIFVGSYLCQLITDQTNLYAKQYLDSNPHLKPCSRAHDWKETIVEELKSFIDILTLQEIYFKEKYSSAYIPEIVVDESLLLWKGRFSWKQFIPTKGSKFR